MNTKYIIYFLLLLIIIMIGGPFITNELMFHNIYKVSEGPSVWIGYLGTFWGAIIGGTISGFITLIGVVLTIRNQRQEEFLRIYPQMMLSGDRITDSCREFISNMGKYLDNLPGNQMSIVVEVDLFHKEIQELLAISAKINGEVYENTRELYGYIYFLNKYIKKQSYNDNGIVQYDLDLKDLTYRLNMFKKAFKKHEELMTVVANKFFELTIVDRVPHQHKKRTKKYLKRAIKEIDKQKQ